MSDPLDRIKGADHWVEWGRESGEAEKRPYSPDGHPTGHALERRDEWGAHGDTWDRRGFVLTGTEFWAVDIDDVAHDGEERIECALGGDHECDIGAAARLMKELSGESYWEKSPSGEGYHLLAGGADLDEHLVHKGEHVELYTAPPGHGRYVTVTGDEVDASAGRVMDLDPARAIGIIDDGTGTAPAEGDEGDGGRAEGAPGNDLDDDEVLEKIRDSEAAERFVALYDEGAVSGHGGDASRADLALLSTLAFWTGGDRDQMRRLFEGSALADGSGEADPVRARHEAIDDYMRRTMDTALEGMEHEDFYTPGSPDWGMVRWQYNDKDIPQKSARRTAAKLLVDEHNWLAPSDTEELHRYDPDAGIWRPDGEQFVHGRLVEELDEHFSTHELKQVVSQLKGPNYVDRDDLGADLSRPLVAVENGALNLETGELLDHSPDHRLIAHVPVEYDPSAGCPEFDGFLDKVLEGDEELKATVYEIFACAVAPGLPADNFVILHGNGRNGKSTLLKVIQRFVGPESATAESLHRLASDNHARTSLYGAKANLAGDLASNRIKRTGLIKRLSGGDTIMANPKGKEPYEFENQAEMVFAANNPPEFDDDSVALMRRLVPIEMPVEIPPDEQEPMERVLARIASADELSGVLNKAIEAYGRVREQSRLTVQQRGEEQIRLEYERHSNPVARFAEACTVPKIGHQVTKTRLYDAYQSWRVDTGAKGLTKAQLTKRLKALDGYEVETKRIRADGERVPVYSGLELTEDGKHHAGIWADRDEGDMELTEAVDG